MNIKETAARVRTAAAGLALVALLAPTMVQAATPPAASDAKAVATPLEGVVNVNAASIEQLQVLPGVGEARAKAIVDTRKELGGFKDVEQLQEVRGIGEALMARLRPYVRTDGKTTARAN